MKIGRSFRIPSVPFFAFKDRRVAYRGFSKALAIAKAIPAGYYPYPDWVFTGPFGSVDWTRVADSSYSYLPYPVWGLCPLYCERYGHSPKYGQIHCEKLYEWSGWRICPSEIVYDLLQKYKVKAEKRIIPTGIDFAKFDRPEITPTETAALREKYEVAEDETLYWACRGSPMKRIFRLLSRPFLVSLKFNQKLSWSWLEMVLIWMIWKTSGETGDFRCGCLYRDDPTKWDSSLL